MSEIEGLVEARVVSTTHQAGPQEVTDRCGTPSLAGVLARILLAKGFEFADGQPVQLIGMAQLTENSNAAPPCFCNSHLAGCFEGSGLLYLPEAAVGPTDMAHGRLSAAQSCGPRV